VNIQKRFVARVGQISGLALRISMALRFSSTSLLPALVDPSCAQSGLDFAPNFVAQFAVLTNKDNECKHESVAAIFTS